MPPILTNEASWKDICEFIEEFPDTDCWNSWRATIKPIIQRAMLARYDTLFRAGSSMHHLIFSTLDRHGLRDEPRVTLLVKDNGTVGVYYSTGGLYFGTPKTAVSEILPTKAVFSVFTRYLQQLWTATMPEPIPELLRKQENYVADA